MSAETIQPESLPAQPRKPRRRSSKAALAAIPTVPGFMSKFSPWREEIGLEIVHRVAMGESIAAICRDEDMPGQRTVHHWLVDNASFRQALAGARATFADRIVEESLDIADDPANQSSHEAVGAARLRIQARQWMASKYKPQAYGDKFDVSGDLTLTTVIRRFSGDTITQDAQVIDVVEESTPKP